MFVAKTSQDQYISLVKSSDYPLLSSYTPPFICPACHNEVIVRKGTRRRWHFAHRKFSPCPGQSEPETKEHLDGKASLYSWLLQTGCSPRLEEYFPSIKRKADLFITWGNQGYAIEFQCSTISCKEIEERTRDYLSIDVIPLWLFSANRLQSKGSSQFFIQSFEWTGMRERKSDSRHVFVYFSPSRSSFYFLFPQALAPPTKVYADFYTFPLHVATFEQLVKIPETTPGKQDWRAIWLPYKKHWRYLVNAWQGKPDYTYMRKVFASHRSDLPFFPSEAGWPVLGMEVFEAPAYIWQSWILLCFLPSIPLYETFLIKDIMQKIMPLVRKNIFKTRDFPLLSSPIEKALVQYFDKLCRFGVVRKSGSGWKKIKDISLPLSLDDAFFMDKMWAGRIF